ncbi:NCS2 family permease [Streptomyces sp. TRM 70351]|uniref:NCS2 family permease n=1 Tax=Streptomyces sp. TRM 70351 TaxID=3116552 RepID=UPI002E7AC78F|nr:NCS2 family permease [Streptomyces sp. TRM 70351]MEE1926865.1 NCS2 family permease [Streptomyces sp. TRM 70351]
MAQSSTEPETAATRAGNGSRPLAGKGWLDRYFHITARGSTTGREVRGGVTTFMAMAYILLLNPLLLSVEDVNGDTLAPTAVVTATALAAALTTVLMGVIGKVPLALAAGLSVSGVLATLVVPSMAWPQAMGMCVIYGVVIMLLVITGLREKIMNAIPMGLKHAITIGIGLFVAMIGLEKAGFVGRGAEGGPPVTLGVGGALTGWPVLAFCITLLAVFMLLARGVPGAILIGIGVGTAFSLVVTALYDLDERAWGLAVPAFPGSPVSSPDFSLLGQIRFGGFAELGAASVTMIVFTLVLAGFFDAMATIIAVGQEAGLADEKGRMPGLNKALLVDGAGGAIGGVASASGQTVFIESASGVGEGARTGLSATVTGLIFAAMLLFTPLAGIVPGQVAAAALVVIGAMMMQNARHVDWNDRAVAIPVFLTVILMPFTFSIVNGVGAGVIAYTAIRLAQGKWREPGLFMWLLTVLFVFNFAFNDLGH